MMSLCRWKPATKPGAPHMRLPMIALPHPKPRFCAVTSLDLHRGHCNFLVDFISGLPLSRQFRQPVQTFTLHPFLRN